MWNLEQAKKVIEAGELICFKTDTVPGIACDPLSSQAVAKIYNLKNRSKQKPLVILVADLLMVNFWVEKYPTKVLRILEKHWPGNLTVIFERKKSAPDLFNTSTIALRIPDKDILRNLLRLTKVGLATTSANISGEAELQTISDIRKKFSDKIALYLEDDQLQSSVPSTIIDVCDADHIKILRGTLNG